MSPDAQANAPEDTVGPIRTNDGDLRQMISDLRRAGAQGYGCRELSLALTRLEEAQHWLAFVPPHPVPDA